MESEMLQRYVLECYGDPFVVGVATISFASAALIGLFVIGPFAIKHLLSMKDMNISLKLLFFTNIWCVFTAGITNIARSIFCMHLQRRSALNVTIMCILCYLGMFLCILGTLLVRLHLTFDNSAYRIGRAVRSTCIAMFAVMLIAGVIVFVVFILSFTLSISDLQVLFAAALPLAWLFFTLYFLSATGAVYLFASNLLKLAKSQRSAEEKSLNERQLLLVATVSKYVSLFMTATASSLLSFLLVYISFYSQIQVTFLCGAVDICFNFSCLYLQYSFAAPYYDRFCCSCGLQRVLRSHVKHSIYQSITASRNMNSADEEDIQIAAYPCTQDQNAIRADNE